MPHRKPGGGEQGVSGFTGLFVLGGKFLESETSGLPAPSEAPKTNLIPPFVRLS